MSCSLSVKSPFVKDSSHGLAVSFSRYKAVPKFYPPREAAEVVTAYLVYSKRNGLSVP